MRGVLFNLSILLYSQLYDNLENPLILARTHCIYYQRCPPPAPIDNDLETGLPGGDPSLPFPFKQRKQKTVKKRGKRSLENAIKVAQTTDVHIDLSYTVVII